jgi:hypothetical protein
MPKSLFYYDFVNKVTYEEEDVLLAVKLDLFAIWTIIWPKLGEIL